MSKDNNTSNKPDVIAYFIKQKDETDKPLWIKVGVGWEHKDQEGFNLLLNNLGQDISLTVRKNTPKPD